VLEPHIPLSVACREELPSLLLAHLTSGDAQRTLVATHLVLQMARHYELRAAEAQRPSVMLQERLVPTLVAIYSTLLRDHNSLEAALVINNIQRTYYYLMNFMLDQHPQLLRSDSVVTWCRLLGQSLAKHLPEPGEPGEPSGQPVNSAAREKWPW
jgi:hypothetical protein